jgi:cell fate (sporulation/competence/biofilm development) regulator YmcA (YheA/YmcA/DUF963 family)
MNKHRELLPVELLVRDDQRVDDHTRRVTIDDQQNFRRALAASQVNRQADPIADEIEADPMIERIARRRKNSEAARTLAILDSLKEGATEA